MNVPSARAATLRAAVAACFAASLLAATSAAAAPPPPAAAPAAEPATIVLSVRSIGSKRGEPLDPRVHAALLVRIPGASTGYIVQGGKEPMPGGLFGTRHRVVGWAIPAQDPVAEFARAVGGYWGEPAVREVPTRDIARFAVPGLTEAKVREVVESLNAELKDREYVLEAGPSSNSYVSRVLDKLGIPLPPLGAEKLPGWGWRP